jgi:poly(3-hydroxybutyrate) depolymerase
VAIDARYHGTGGGYDAYVAAILRAYRTAREHPFLYDTIWDVIRLVDYLETRPDVDGARIGLMGYSKGGMETYLTAAIEPRIAAAVPLIGVQSFRFGLENDAWQSRVESIQEAVDGAARDDGLSTVTVDFVRKFYDRVVPGIYDDLDGPAMLPAIAPRPLMAVNSDDDPRTPLPGVEAAARAAAAAYARMGAADRFVLRIQKGAGHRVTAESETAAVAWMVRWLSGS